MPIAAGDILGDKYRIIELIGQGSMANVWLAEDSGFANRRVAIKEPRDDLSTNQQEYVEERFRREVQVCASLTDAGVPNLVNATTAIQHGKMQLLIMDYMPGGDLAGLIKQHPEGLPIERAIEITLHICEALAGVHTHELEIVHRDVKPSNILFDANGRARLGDFGLAQVGGDSSGTTNVVGTPLYMAPEQGMGKGYLTPAADVYSLGCVLFEMITGQRYKKHKPGSPARKLRRGAPAWLDRVLAKALAEDPYARWATAQELADALRQGGPKWRRWAPAAAAAAGGVVILLLTIFVLPGLLGGGGTPAEPTTVAHLVTATDTPGPGATPLVEILTATETWTPTPSNTPASPTETHTSMATVTASPTPAPPTATDTPTATATHTGTATAAPTVTRTPTPAPPAATISIIPTNLGEPPSTTGPRLPNTFVRAGIDYRLVEGGVLVVFILVGMFLKNHLRRAPLAWWGRRVRVKLADGVEMELVRVGAGEFLMGSDPKRDSLAYGDEQPQRRVHLEEYWMGRYPVTNAQYQAFVAATGKGAPSHWSEGNIPKGKETHPVVEVNWDDAAAFCEWASRLAGVEIRLPTEAEWEKAARGTDGRIYPWGDERPDSERCNFDDHLGDTTPVGRYSPAGDSPYGCADMAGNVWEWVSDWYDEDYYKNSPRENPAGPATGSSRVLRGGSWFINVRGVRSAYRGWNDPDFRNDLVGFRCARSP
jgi:formylglycine-generating enzyme required for sulfatase activity/serine/threonine protein kinase